MNIESIKNGRNRVGIVAIALILQLMGCASAKSSVAPEPVVAPVNVAAQEASAVPGEQVDTIEVEQPSVSQELNQLREAVKHGVDSEIETAAHVIIDADPGSDDSQEALRALAEVMVRRGLLSQAQLYAQTASDSHPDSYDNVIMLARIAHLSERNDEAIKWLKQASDIEPGKSEPYVIRAGILLQFLDVERALDSATKAHELSPSDCRVMVTYADALFANHQFPESAAQYEQADGGACTLTEVAMQNMAKLYEVHVQDAGKACRMYQRLTDAAPDNAYYKASRDYQCSLQ